MYNNDFYEIIVKGFKFCITLEKLIFMRVAFIPHVEQGRKLTELCG